MEQEGNGVVMLVYSLILTRGVESVAREMESVGITPSLIGSHDYAQQV
jgi:hypothetical protein